MAMTDAASGTNSRSPLLHASDPEPGEVTAWWAPIASALLPGSGQATLDQDRFLAYMAVEGYVLLRYRSDLDEARRQRRAYRALALEVARALVPGPKPIGDFAYYERMEHFVESGSFDTDPMLNGVQPEPDTSTFNGSLWLLARRTFWADPDSVPDAAAYAIALDFYLNGAVRPAFRWSWRGAELEHDLFRQTIVRSNDAFRRSITDLGILLANHVLSAVDAYVTVRMRRTESAAQSSSYELSATIPWPLPRPHHER